MTSRYGTRNTIRGNRNEPPEHRRGARANDEVRCETQPTFLPHRARRDEARESAAYERCDERKILRTANGPIRRWDVEDGRWSKRIQKEAAASLPIDTLRSKTGRAEVEESIGPTPASSTSGSTEEAAARTVGASSPARCRGKVYSVAVCRASGYWLRHAVRQRDRQAIARRSWCNRNRRVPASAQGKRPPDMPTASRRIRKPNAEWICPSTIHN